MNQCNEWLTLSHIIDRMKVKPRTEPRLFDTPLGSSFAQKYTFKLSSDPEFTADLSKALFSRKNSAKRSAFERYGNIKWQNANQTWYKKQLEICIKEGEESRIPWDKFPKP
mmetsp:Transcript_19300/g.32281  ORF Transcript_19300/g.32281 Transcript_19300/m.32281 type:complete len:111 (+) Transcript_19300:293-625(+)